MEKCRCRPKRVGILSLEKEQKLISSWLARPVVQLLANDVGYPAAWVSNDDDRRKLVDASDWVLMTRNKPFLDHLETSKFVEPIVVPPKLRLWTDDYNNLFEILRPVKFGKAASE